MLNKPIWALTASELCKKTKNNELSATEITVACLEQTKKVNPQLNAIVDDMSDEAIKRAESLDSEVAAGKPKGRLFGVPVTVKINVDQKGYATSNGVTALKNLIAKTNAPIVDHLMDAGAVFVGRTNTPEFSFRADTENPLYGRTNNPWGKHLSPGGSSGGASSAVMAGMCTLAHGNDIGGSLRFPSVATGAVTLKPGLGRVPAWNSSQTSERGILAQSMSVQGLITRSAYDLQLAMPEVIQSDLRDPFHVPMPWDTSHLSENSRKVALCFETPGFKTDPEIVKGLKIAADALSDVGFEIHEVTPPLLEETAKTGYSALLGEVQALLGEDIRRNGSEKIQMIFDEYFRQFEPYDGKKLLTAMANRTHYAREWSLFMDEYPLIISNLIPTSFFYPDRDSEGKSGVTEVLGAALWSYSMNFIGHPAGIVPTHIANTKGGPVPIGIQIIGRRWREDTVVAALIAIEDYCGTFYEKLWEKLGWLN